MPAPKIGCKIFFGGNDADDGIHGRELWATDLLTTSAWIYLPLIMK